MSYAARIILLIAFFGPMIPAYIWGIPAGADLDNHFRSVQPFYDELAAGNLMPGWLAESNNGFGDARFRFYPPMLYYLLSAVRWLAGDWYAATLITFTLLSTLGAIGMFAWARDHLPVGPSVFAACLFAFTPYHLAQFYQASLLADPARAAYYDYRNNFLFSPFSVPGLNTWYGSMIAILTLAIASPALVTLPRIVGSQSLFEPKTRRVLLAAAIVAALSLIGFFEKPTANVAYDGEEV